MIGNNFRRLVCVYLYYRWSEIRTAAVNEVVPFESSKRPAKINCERAVKHDKGWSEKRNSNGEWRCGGAQSNHRRCILSGEQYANSKAERWRRGVAIYQRRGTASKEGRDGILDGLPTPDDCARYSRSILIYFNQTLYKLHKGMN